MSPRRVVRLHWSVWVDARCGRPKCRQSHQTTHALSFRGEATQFRNDIAPSRILADGRQHSTASNEELHEGQRLMSSVGLKLRSILVGSLPIAHIETDFDRILRKQEMIVADRADSEQAIGLGKQHAPEICFISDKCGNTQHDGSGISHARFASYRKGLFNIRTCIKPTAAKTIEISAKRQRHGFKAGWVKLLGEPQRLCCMV